MATSSSPVTAATNAVAKGTVVFVQGEAYLRDNSGKLSAIKPGDVVTEGQEIVTRNGAVVELQLPGGAKVSVGPNRELLLNDELFATATPERSDNALSSLGAEADKVIQALNAGKDPFEGLEDPAAGLTGGGLGDQTHDFVRLVRVLEEVTPVSYNYATTADGVEFLPAAAFTTQTVNTPPVATDDNVSGTEDQPLIVDVLANDSDANNDPLVVTSATATNGQVTINPDGSLRYVPNPDFNGPDTVTYTISDGKGGTSTATVTINVAAVNDAPIARPDVATTPEDQPVTVNVLGNDSDPDGDPLSVTGATVDPALGSVVVNPDGTLTFTPTPDFNGPVVITYTVSDGKGGTASSTVTVNVTPVNDNPVANPDVATTLENTPITVPVLGNDSDPEGNPLTVTGATVDPAVGSVAINPDGTLTFTPAPNFNGPVVINYTISDGQGGTATSTVTVNVTPDNAAPVANPDSATTPEDQPVTVNVLGNDSDPDGDPLSVTGASVDPAKGTVVVNPDGTLTFNPAANVNGPVVVTYTIADGNGGTATSTITIDVTPQNDAPVATPDSTTTPEDQPVTINVLGNDSDPDGDTLSVTGATVDPAKGNVVVNPDGTLTFTPAANINGPVVVTYTIADGKGGSATSTVTIDVIPDADDAQLGSGSGSVKEDTPAQSTASGTLSIVDPDAGEAAFQPQTNAAGTYGSFSVNAAGAWIYTIDNSLPVVQALKEGETRTESFTVHSVDGTATTVSLTIVGTNDGPVANPNIATTPEEQPVTINVLGNDSDPDGDTLSVTSASVDPTKGSVTVNPDGTLTFTPAANINGPVVVTYSIADGHGGTASSTVTINVTPVNDNATISTGAGTTQEDTVLLASGTLTITDPDAGEAAFQAQTGTAGTYGSFSIDETGHWAFTLDNGNPLVQNLADGDSRTESFTVRSVDGTESTVVITILGTNESIGAPGVGIVKEDNTLSTGGSLSASGGASFVAQPATPGTYGSFTLNTDGSWNYVLNNPASVVQSLGEGQTRSETFPVTLSDGTASTVTITVVGTNDPALIGPGSGNVTEDSVPSTGGTLSITDVDGGEAGFRPQTSVAGTYGSFSLDAAGNWTYTLNNAHPDVQALGVGDTLSETFPVQSTDGSASNVFITINGTNDGPVANPNTATTPEDQPVTVNVLGNDTDPDGDTLSVTGATVDPAKGSVVVNADGTLTFTPAANINGPVVVTYTISDGHGGTATSTVSITVTPVADAAVLGTGSGSVKEDTPTQSTASGTLSIVDPDAGEAVFQAQTNAAGTYGSFSVNAAGAWTYTIDNSLPVVQALKEGETRTESFTVRSADGTATTVNLTIVGTNDGPVANPNTATTPEDQAVTVNVLGNDTDPDGDTLSVTSATVDPAKGSVVVNADGTLTFNPAANVNGPVVVTYTIADGKGGTASSTVTIDVTPVNDAPVAHDDANGLVKTDTTPATGNVITNPAGLDTDLDGDTLSVSLIGSAPVSGATVVSGAFGTLTIHPDGSYSYIQDTTNSTVTGLAPGATLTDSFSYTVSDGKGGTATAELRITIAGLNTPPIATPDAATTNEDEPVRIAVLGNDSDPEGDPLSITSATVDPTKGSVVVNADGTLTFNPAPNFNGPVVVTYTISDGKGGTATSTVNITVNPVNDAPVANPNAATTPEDQPVTVNVLGNDSDPDGDTLSVTGATVDPAKGSVVVNADGTLTFNPAANVNGPVVVTYSIADGKGGTASSTVTINVTPVNDAPVAVNDTASTSEDSPVSRSAALGVLANDSDIDSASLTVSGVRVGTSGAFAAPGAAGITLTGTYGSLLIRADGSYTYTPGAAAQALNTGDSVQDVFSYQLSDGSLSATANLSITVTGANDAAVITGLAAGTVKEDTAGQLTATGTLAATDADSPATFTPASAAGTYGSFSIAANGTWTYTLSNAAANVQALKEGDIRTETFVVTTADGTARNVVVTVLGTNEIPTVANVTATGAEDPATPIPVVIAGNDVDGTVTSLTLADLPANGTLYRDAAMTQPVTVGTPISATAGAVTLYFKPGANWNGETSFHFSATDNNGGNSGQATASITVTPVADAAVLGTGSGSVKEDTPAQSTASGTLTIVDPDAGEAVFQPQTNVAGTYGSFSVNSAGAWTYTIDNTRPVVQALKEGETRTESFTVRSADGTATTVNLTIVGTNDGPVANPNTATTPEDQPVTVNVLGNDTDPDGDTLSVTGATVDPAKGSVVVNADGTLTFNPAANINGPVLVTYTIADGHGGTASSTVTINVTPVNDAPVALDDANGLSKTATNPATGNVITNPAGLDSDLDGDTLSVSRIGSTAVTGSTVVNGAFGTLTIHPDGSYSYSQDSTNSAVASLAPGASLVDSFTYTVSDGKGGTDTAQLVLTISGTNTAPVANPNSATTPEDQPVTVNVLGNDTDPEGDTLSVTGASVDPAKGSVVVNADGTLTFNPVSNFNGPVVISYTISDGHGGTATSTVSINVTPVADAAVLGTGSGSVKEDTPAQSTASGTLSIVDPDAGEAVFQPQTNTAGTYGSFSVNTAGAWTYTIDNTKANVQALKEGETRTESFTVRSADGTATTVNLTIVGTNDGPVANPNTATTPEDQPVTVNVLGNDSDPDGDTLSVTSATVDPAKGSVVVNADGTLTFNPAANINGPVVVTYTIADGKGGTASSTLTINVTPVNDAPVAVNDLASTSEDAPVSRSAALGVLANDSDIDSASLTVSGVRVGTSGAFAAPGAAGITLTGTYGSLLIHADGSYTYTPGAAAQALNTGDSVQDVFSYQLSDGSLTAVANLSITVTGANDAAVITGLAAGTVKEDTAGQLTATGTLAATDVDSPATFTPASAAGTYGSFSIAANGTWTYTLSNAAANVQALKEGDTRTETFVVTTADGTARNVVVTVLGTNEIPTVANVTATGAEDPAAPIPVVLAGSDVDGTVTSLTLADLPANGTLYRDAAMTQPVTVGTPISATAGAVTLYFKPGANWNGETSFHFSATDNNGGSSGQATASITVTPVADAAVLGTGSGSVKEDTPAQSTASGTLSIVDPDAGEAVFQAQTNVAGTYGSFSVNSAGAWTYTIDNTRPVVQALKEGETRTESFTVRSADGTATTVNLTIVGTNDGPVANPNTATTPEDQPVTVNVLGNDTDPDGDTLTVTSATVDPAKGSVTVNADGTLTFNPAANINGPVVVTYTIADGKGGTASSTVTINVTPVNDAPVAVNDTASTSEDNPVSRSAALGVLANDSDIDSASLTVSGVRVGTAGAFAAPGAAGITLTGTYGSLLIRADGSYTYTPGAAAQALNTGDSVQDVFSYQLSDGSLTATANLSITVIGANDPAVITGTAAGTVKEDTAGQLTVTGTLTATDVDSSTSFSPANATGTYGSFSMAANGTWTYALNNAAANVQALKEGDIRTETFVVTTADGTTRNVVVTVLGTNEIPTVANVSATGAEDPAAPIPVVLAGSDVDGTVASLTLADLPANGTLYRDAAMTQPVSAGTPLAATGGAVTLYFQPGANWNGSTNFHFTATDNNGGNSGQATASITVTPVNDPPVAIADTGSTNQDTALVRNAASGVLTNDSDIDGGTLGVSSIAAGSGASVPVVAGGTSVSGAFGTLLIAQDGGYTYTPGASAKALTLGQSASDVFTYTVSDGNGGTATTTLTIQVNGLNDAPVIGGVATGNVTEDGTLTAGGSLTISDADAGQSSFVPQTLTGTYGTLTLQSSGNWSYSLNNATTNVQSLKQGEVVQDNFSVHSADGTAKTVTINVTGTNDAPVVGTATVSVSEEGLAGGIADTTGNTDTTNQTTAGGTISVSDVDGNALTVTLTAPTAALSSNGVAITWTGSGTQTLVGSAGSLEIIRATIANDGTQSVKLSGPIDHPNTTQEDVVTLNLGVNVNDGVTTTSSTLVVRVEDDAPKASSVNQSVVVAPQDTNLLIVLDNSGSMNTADGVGGTTRLKSAITALTQLIDTYDALGEVRIRIVTFNSAATSVGTAWTTVDLGKTQLGNVTLGGTTNYDAAIVTAQTAYTSTGKLASGQNVAYFLSDGVPNSGTEIGTADETAWKAFLTANGITSYALGMGAGASQGPLNPIAYDGLTKTDLNASVITDFAQLSNALQATIPQSASGDILSGGLLGGTSGFGGDGGHISSITIEGVTYTYNPAGATSVTQSGGTGNGTYNATTHLLTVRTDDGGTLVVNMSTGSYNYTPRATITTPIVDGFNFVLADKDGDTASASVTFNVSRQAEQVVTLTSTSTVIESSRLGLTGEYYGYNETTAGVTRTHADDTTLGNLDHVSDMTTIVDGRSSQTVVGTYNAAPATGSDATFSADKIDYGFGYTTGSTTVGAVNGNLGNNPTIGTNMAVNSGALYNFLRGGTTGSDASTLTTTTGLGNTTDSGLRFVGLMNVAGGIYDIRVTADDGFRINIGGQTVAMFDNIQSPTARTYTGISMESGLQPIEILYWEQGGNARLRIEVKLSSEADTAYKTLGTDEFALFTPTSAPVLNDLQDIVESSTNGTWLVRTGERLDGTSGNDHITGSDGQDMIYGGAGNDTIIGGSGASLISGGAGNDTLTGGLGSDTFKWSLGDAGSAGAPALDAITDFNKAAAISGGDVLDLGDLLQGESHAGTNPGNLGSYLHFEKSGTDTVVHISSTGGYTGGTFSAGATDQKIVLQGVDLTNSGALSTDAQIIQDLLTKGKLSAD